MEIKITKLHPDAILPTRGSKGAAGWDLYALGEPSIAGSFTKFSYRTGIAIEIPEGHFGMIAPRSSIYKTDLRQCNQPGIIDEDYRGEIKFIFDYTGENDIGHMLKDDFEEFYKSDRIYQAGDRIGQLIILPYKVQEYKLVTTLNVTDRGSKGFGSSGK